MSSNRISVIIPFFNAGRYLRRCLESVVSQDFSEYEIICVNDGSTDESLSIAEEFAGRFPYVRVISQENRGLSNARNRGMEVAEGEYILFADGDDYLEKNVIGKLYNICRDRRLDMLDFRVNIVTGGGTLSMYPEVIETTGVSEGREYIIKFINEHGKQPFVSAWSHMYRREFLVRNGLLFIDGRKYEDLVFTATAYISARAVMYLDLPVYNYVKVQGSITTSGISPAHISDMQFMAEQTGRLSKVSGIRIPMDNFFSGIRNQVITALKMGKWREYRKLFDRNLFRTTEFNVYRPSFRVIYPLARVNYSIFILYCRLTSVMKHLRLKYGLRRNRFELK